MSARRAIVAAAAVACALGAPCRTAAGHSSELEIQLIEPESGDGAVNLLTTFYLDGGASASGPYALSGYLSRRSAVDLYLFDLAGDRDILLDVGLRYFLTAERSVSLEARVFNPTDATLGSIAPIYGYENPVKVLDHAFEFGGQHWTVGATAWLGPSVALTIPLAGGTLDDASGAESFDATVDWIKVRFVSGSGRPAADVSVEASLEDDVDCYTLRAMVYPDRALGVGAQLWFSDDGLESYELVASYDARSAFGRLGAWIDEDSGDTMLRLALGARF